MVRYYKKVSFFKVYESWFTYQFQLKHLFSLNAFFHLKNKKKWIPAIGKKTYTLELNLEDDVDVITLKFNKQIRQQVKIAEKEGTTCCFENEIEKFVEFFNDFAKKKDTWLTTEQRIRDMGDHVKLSFALNNGVILAAHSYIVDREIGIVRQLHSATKRLDENYDRNFIGRANKYLTVKDMFYFKENGFKIFDFGGFAKDTENESLKGINNFKLQFGGELTACTDYYSVNYWLLKKISKLVKVSGNV